MKLVMSATIADNLVSVDSITDYIESFSEVVQSVDIASMSAQVGTTESESELSSENGIQRSSFTAIITSPSAGDSATIAGKGPMKALPTTTALVSKFKEEKHSNSDPSGDSETDPERARLARMALAMQLKDERYSRHKKATGKSLIVFEVKPYDVDSDLKALWRQIIT